MEHKIWHTLYQGQLKYRDRKLFPFLWDQPLTWQTQSIESPTEYLWKSFLSRYFSFLSIVLHLSALILCQSDLSLFLCGFLSCTCCISVWKVRPFVEKVRSFVWAKTFWVKTFPIALGAIPYQRPDNLWRSYRWSIKKFWWPEYYSSTQRWKMRMICIYVLPNSRK